MPELLNPAQADYIAIPKQAQQVAQPKAPPTPQAPKDPFRRSPGPLAILLPYADESPVQQSRGTPIRLSNQEAFLNSIRENPGDEAPALIYADWLEENGDPDLA